MGETGEEEKSIGERRAEQINAAAKEFDGIEKLIEDTPIEEIKKKLPDEIYKMLYRAVLVNVQWMKRQTGIRTKKEAVSTVINLLGNERFFKVVKLLEADVDKEKEDKKKEVEWIGKKK